jgi:hypothetical protein
MGSGSLAGPAVEKTTFDDLVTMLVEDYRVNGRKSLGRVRYVLAHLQEFFGRMHAVDFTPDRVTAYISWRLDDPERPGKPATVRNEIRALGRNFERAGVSRSAAMKLSGHKTESIYRRYAIVSEADLADGVRKVAALQAGDASVSHRIVRVSELGIPRTSTVRAQSAIGVRDAQRLPST